jgi:hypothetical protein
VVDRVDLAAAIETDVVDNLGEVFPVLGEVGPALARLSELEGALHVVALAALHGGLFLAGAGELLEVKLC